MTQEAVLPGVRGAGVLVDPGICHKLDAGVQLHRVAALYRHLQSVISGNGHTVTSHHILTLASLFTRRGSLGGRLAAGLGVFLLEGRASSRLAFSRAPSRSRGKLAVRAASSASAAALRAMALASAVRISTPWEQEG